MGVGPSNTPKWSDENLESLSLIWLDADVNKSNENIDVQKRLRSVLNDGRLLFIVNGGLGREIVPRIFKLRQVLVIYVFLLWQKKTWKMD